MPCSKQSIPWPALRRVAVVLVFWLGVFGLVRADDTPKPAANREAARNGQRFRVPYQMTETKHILVRAKINGKGPFHFIIDTGAPALFVSTESAKKHGLTSGKGGLTEFDQLEIEGGVVLKKVKGRVETPFQVSGMNAMGLPGIRLDGMVGYTILAQFRVELDLTKQHMVWTKLDWTPPFPPGLTGDGQAPPEVAVMGGLVKVLQWLVPKKPDPVFVPRGCLGLELAEGANGVQIKQVLAGCAGAEAGLKVGDCITRFQEQAIKNLAELHKLAGEHAGQGTVRLEVEREGKKLTITAETGKGL